MVNQPLSAQRRGQGTLEFVVLLAGLTAFGMFVAGSFMNKDGIIDKVHDRPVKKIAEDK